jgi:hypothetical protein
VCTGHAEDLGVDAQLILRADAITVGGQQRELGGAVAHRAACRELGRRGGLAHAGRSDQRVYAAARDQLVGGIDGREIARQHAGEPRLRLGRIEIVRQALGDRARECGAVAREQQLARQTRAQRRAAQRVAPGELRHLLLQ